MDEAYTDVHEESSRKRYPNQLQRGRHDLKIQENGSDAPLQSCLLIYLLLNNNILK